MKALPIAATVAALYTSPALAAEGNKHLGKVQFETFCKPNRPKCAVAALNLFTYSGISPPVANLPLGVALTQKQRTR